MTVEEALELARRHGVKVVLDGDEPRASRPTRRLRLACSRSSVAASGTSSPRCASARPRSAAVSCSGSTTTSPRHHPASAPIAATGRDQWTLSSCCSSETIGARCTPHVIQPGWQSEKPRRAEPSGLSRPREGTGGVKLRDGPQCCTVAAPGSQITWPRLPWICAACATAQLAAGGNHIIGFTGPFVGGAPTPARDVDSYGIKIRTDGESRSVESPQGAAGSSAPKRGGIQ